ncbi:MAG: MFS transporter [Pacificimonas sp.]|nr:MFS transporter [Pacificimonas sp.]
MTSRTIGIFGTLSLPVGMLALPVAIYLAPLYSGQLGIALGLVGTALLITRLFDVVTDPMIGIISDRWRPAIGRRKVWLILGTVTLMGGVWMLFRPPLDATFLYLVIAVSLLYFGITTLRLPYYAWSAELSPDYNLRTRISSTIQFFLIIGILLSALIPAWVTEQAGATSVDVMATTGLVIVALLPPIAALIFFTVPEPPAPVRKASLSPLALAKVVISNGPFVRIVTVILIISTGEAVRQSLTVFFARDLVGVENVPVLYFYYFIAGLVCVPLWAWLAKRMEKHRAFALALVLVAITNFAMLFVGPGDNAVFVAIFVAKGACYGALLLLPNAMIADAADIDTAKSSDRQQGLFYSAESMVQKFGVAIGAGVPLIVLGWVGYDASGETAAEPLLALQLIYGLAPGVLVLGGAAIIWGYSLTAERHSALRAEIEAKRAAAAD